MRKKDENSEEAAKRRKQRAKKRKQQMEKQIEEDKVSQAICHFEYQMFCLANTCLKHQVNVFSF